MLGQPIYMVTPQVVGFKLKGELPEGSTATDLVLVITQILRSHGVVEKFVEFYGEGLASMTVADRATIANMAPEYGATMGFFPVDDQTLAYLRLTGRDAKQIDLVERYCKEQGLWRQQRRRAEVHREAGAGSAHGDAQRGRPAAAAGPRRAARREAVVSIGAGGRVQERRRRVRHAAARSLVGRRRRCSAGADGHAGRRQRTRTSTRPPPPSISRTRRTRAIAVMEDQWVKLTHGDVVIAAITSCTNTSNPSVMVAAGSAGQEGGREGPDACRRM